MEGVGARLGRSSTRYGPSSTVFNGPVRKWKKKWVPPPPSSSNNNASSNHQSSTTTNHHNNGNNNSNSNGSSHLLLYKWTPISQSQNGNNRNADKSSPHNAAAAEEPPRRKFKYIPIAVVEEQRNEAEEDEAEPSDKPDINNGLDDKPNMNDVPMEESQPPDDTPLTRQDLNVSTLDLSLGLKASDGDADSDGKED